MTIAFSTLVVITGFLIYFYIKELLITSTLKDTISLLESNEEFLISKLEDNKKVYTELQDAYIDVFEKHDKFLGKVVDKASKTVRTVYYVPRLDEMVEYKELVELGEL